MANPKLGAKSVPGVACYPLVTHKKFSNKFWGSHNWCPWTHILDSHIGQSYWTVIMTVLFFIVPVQYDCPVCEMCLNKPSSSHKNVRPLFIVKIWILGYNVFKYLLLLCHNAHVMIINVCSWSIGNLGNSVDIYPIFGNAANQRTDQRRATTESDSVRCVGRGSPKTRRKWTEKAQIKKKLPPTGCLSLIPRSRSQTQWMEDP